MNNGNYWRVKKVLSKILAKIAVHNFDFYSPHVSF